MELYLNLRFEEAALNGIGKVATIGPSYTVNKPAPSALDVPVRSNIKLKSKSKLTAAQVPAQLYLYGASGSWTIL